MMGLGWWFLLQLLSYHALTIAHRTESWQSEDTATTTSGTNRHNELWEEVPTSSSSWSDKADQQHRRFQQSLTKTTCNSVLASWTAQATYINFFNALGKTNSTLAQVLQVILQGKFLYGVRFTIVCGKCRDVLSRMDPSLSSSAALTDICGRKAYGENTLMSGLVMMPLTADGNHLAKGIMKGIVYCHGTRTNTWPSIDFTGSNTRIETMQFAALTSLGGSVVIIPDYMGFGASLGILKKGYGVLKSYQTSFLPLWYQTQYGLAKESNCTTLLSNHAALVGYSEGGYASVAVAQALTKVGIHVIHVDSGGAPFRIASSALLGIVQNVDMGTFPLNDRYVLALFGSAYSGTYPLPNSNTSKQYLLLSNVRNIFVQLVTNSSSNNALLAQIVSHNVLSIFNGQYIALARAAIAAGSLYNGCNNITTATKQNIGLLCDALVLNDLTNYLERNVNYPVRLCHSPQDSLVVYANLPNISRNSRYLSLISGVTGSHEDAALFCVVQAFLYLITAEFQNYKTTSTSSSGDKPINQTLLSNGFSCSGTHKHQSSTQSGLSSPTTTTMTSQVPQFVTAHPVQGPISSTLTTTATSSVQKQFCYPCPFKVLLCLTCLSLLLLLSVLC